MKKFLSVLLIILCTFSLQISAQKKSAKLPTPIRLVAPIIGVSSTAEEGMAAAPLTYINAIKKAGGVPLVIPMTSDSTELARVLGVIDGLVMTGGEDVDPLKNYGEEPLRAMGEIAPKRDAFDMLLAKMAVARGVPVLGICRGCQVLNVAFGGTLYQDIPSQVPTSTVKHRQSAPREYGTHSIHIESGSVLHSLLLVDSIAVNSYHHQAVKDIAPCFKVTARSSDGIVEAIEPIGAARKDVKNVLGVQFHPEGLVSAGDDTFLPLFNWLINIVKNK